MRRQITKTQFYRSGGFAKPEQHVKSCEQPAPVLVEYELLCRKGEGKAMLGIDPKWSRDKS